MKRIHASTGLQTSGTSRVVERGFVLLVADEPRWMRALQRILEADGHRVERAAEADEALRRLGDIDLAVALVDLAMSHTSGLDVLDRIKRDRPEVQVIMLTGRAHIDSAVGCMRRGAFDYLAKPFEDEHRVRITVKHALERARLVRRNRELENAVESARATAPGPRLAAWDSRPSPVQGEGTDAGRGALDRLPLSLDAYEKLALERALEETSGDARAAARALGMGRSTLYRKLAKHGLRARHTSDGRTEESGSGLGRAWPIG